MIRSILTDLEFLLFVKTNLHFELPLQRMANILVKKNEEEVVTELCKLVEKEAKDAIAAHGTFHLGLSGGSLASFLCRFETNTGLITKSGIFDHSFQRSSVHFHRLGCLAIVLL